MPPSTHAAGKAGVVRLTASLANLGKTVGVRVNCIWVGIETEAVREAQSMPPPPVLIQPDEIADAVVMFVRDEALAGRVMG